MSSDLSRSSTVPSTWTRWWNRTRYQLYAPVYDWLAWPLEQGRERAIDQLELTPDDRILLLGCGPGSDLEYLPSEASVTALDAAPAMVRRTKQRAETLGMEADVRVGNARSLSFGEDAFDAVLLHLILPVVPDPEAVVAETARVLVPDGRASVYDKFIPEGTEPSLIRRALNPAARFLFSDLTRQLEPMLSGTDLEIDRRETALGGLYTVARLHPIGDEVHNTEAPAS